MEINTLSSPTNLFERMSIKSDTLKGILPIQPNPINTGASKSFSELMAQKISSINESQNASSELLAAVETGESDDLVGAMVASQKASLSFSAMMQIRNKLVQAFDEVIKMPI